MNTKYIVIVLAEPYSVFSEILGKYFSKKIKSKKKIIIIGSINLFEDQLKELRYKIDLNEINNLSEASLNKINIININFEYKKVFTKISSKSNDYIENSFYNFFQYPEASFPDVLLRTAGEKRISNFLLYQLSYSELIFIDTLWPDVNEDILDDVLLEFNRRNRTYGRN